MSFLLGERSMRDAIRVPPPEPSRRTRPPAHMPSPSPRCRAAPPLPSALRADGRGAATGETGSSPGRAAARVGEVARAARRATEGA